MTDADVDGAHIAALLMTFFYKEIPALIESNHLYIAVPPLFRLSQGTKTLYARDEKHKNELIASEFREKGKIEISRFKGLGEMPSQQLKQTTMDPEKRVLMRITVPTQKTDEGILESRETSKLVENLMGKKPEHRFNFIKKNAQFVNKIELDL